MDNRNSNTWFKKLLAFLLVSTLIYLFCFSSYGTQMDPSLLVKLCILSMVILIIALFLLWLFLKIANISVRDVFGHRSIGAQMEPIDPQMNFHLLPEIQHRRFREFPECSYLDRVRNSLAGNVQHMDIANQILRDRHRNRHLVNQPLVGIERDMVTVESLGPTPSIDGPRNQLTWLLRQQNEESSTTRREDSARKESDSMTTNVGSFLMDSDSSGTTEDNE